MGTDHAFVWTNDQYGRMMYAGFGHEPAIYRDVNVRTMLRNAILWAAETPVQAIEARLLELADGDAYRVDACGAEGRHHGCNKGNERE